MESFQMEQIEQTEQTYPSLTYEHMKQNVKEYLEKNQDKLVSINTIWHYLSENNINPLIKFDFIKAVHELDLAYYYHKQTLYVFMTNKSEWEYNIEKMEIVEDKETYFTEEEFLSLYFNLDLEEVDNYIVDYLISSNNVKYMRHALEEYEFDKEEYTHFLKLATCLPEMKCLLIKYKYKTKNNKLKRKYKSLEEDNKILDDINIQLSNRLNESERTIMKYNYYGTNICLISVLSFMFYMLLKY